MSEAVIKWLCETKPEPLACDGCLTPIKQRTLHVVVGVGQFHDERCAALHGRWLAKIARNFGPLLKDKSK